MNKPDFTKPVDILAFFYNEFGACGCSEVDTMIDVIRDLLEWLDSDIDTRPKYNTLFNGNVGVYYLLAGKLEYLEFSGHGFSIRVAWLTEEGQEFLSALKNFSNEEIEYACGGAYDDAYYGNND